MATSKFNFVFISHIFKSSSQHINAKINDFFYDDIEGLKSPGIWLSCIMYLKAGEAKHTTR